jgi:hypothetical protein
VAPGGPAARRAAVPGAHEHRLLPQPNADAVIAPLPGRAADGFAPVVAGDYLRAKIDKYYAHRSAAAGSAEPT